MCVIFFAYHHHPDFPLVLLANRDEFYDRPTAAAGFWEDAPRIFAGRDLLFGGTWLGITETGRFAAVTNYRDPRAPKGGSSRGALVGDFLAGDVSTEEYLHDVRRRAGEFSGFNLLVGELRPEKQTLGYFSNRGNDVEMLGPGVYGLSNHLLDTPWPKVESGKNRLRALLAAAEPDKREMFEILRDRTTAADRDLPETGVGLERERLLSSIFIETPVYGTRSSSVVLFGRDYRISLDERVYR
ncbi:MAG: NRDE family protein [Acidobacteria bacterium]|nr:NRDE family protein [Acidobacteriota bacterium]